MERWEGHSRSSFIQSKSSFDVCLTIILLETQVSTVDLRWLKNLEAGLLHYSIPFMQITSTIDRACCYHHHVWQPGRYSLVWKPHLYCSKHLVSSKHKTFFQEAANPIELESVDFGADSSFSFSTLSAHRGLVSSGLQAWALLVCELLPNSQTNFLSCENNSLGLLPELGKQCHIWITCLCTTVWTNMCKPTVLLLRSLPSSLDFHIVLSQSSGCYERNAFYGNSKGKPALVDHDQQQELNRPGSCQAERRIFSTIY